MVVAPAKYQQHGRVHKTSCVNVFGTKMQHRQHFGLGQYRIHHGRVSDMLHGIFYIFLVMVWNPMRHMHKRDLQVHLVKI